MNSYSFLTDHNNQSDGQSKKVCVIGLGYVGLTMALVLSECGLKVFGIERNKKIVENINNKKPHFYEKGLVELLDRQLHNGFECIESLPLDINISVYVIAVGTNVNENNQPDFSQLENASLEIGLVLKKNDLIILRSTVPVSTTRNFVIPILEKQSGLKAGEDFFISFAPERTVEGNALEELRSLPQILGGLDSESVNKTASLFSLFAPNIIIMNSLEEAEIIKMINNSYRDLTFAFSNELAIICDLFNIPSKKIIEAANFGYQRSQMPLPSPGVGGYCLTKDPYLLIYSAEQKGYQPKLPAVGREINKTMSHFCYHKIKNFYDKFYHPEAIKEIAILGLAFKGNPPTSDIRFSPTIDLINILKSKNNTNLYGHDFVVSADDINNTGAKSIKEITECFRDKQCVVIANNHPSYKNINIPELVKLMHKPAMVLDCWSQFNASLITTVEGVYYSNLGYDNYCENKKGGFNTEQIKPILITGGTGYVGSRVAQKLATEGYRVIVADKVKPEERGIVFHPLIEFRHGDLRIPENSQKAVKGVGLVLHLAANIGPLTYMHEHQAEIIQENSAIDAAFYPACVAEGVEAVIYSSSSMVFQHAPHYPYQEKDVVNILPPTNVYGFSKLNGEYFCYSYKEQYGLPYVIIRYHNIYGPGEDSKGSTPGDIHVIPALVEKTLKGQYPLELIGNPEATRPFTYVDDAVDTTIKIIKLALKKDSRIINNDFNIGSKEVLKISDLAEKIWRIVGDNRPFQYVVKPTKAITAERREMDTSKIFSVNIWQPQVSLEEGIKKTAEWIRNRSTI